MKRRAFLKLCISGTVFALFGKKANAKEKTEKPLKEAMFWKKVD
jgi:hypothetical protein